MIAVLALIAIDAATAAFLAWAGERPYWPTFAYVLTGSAAYSAIWPIRNAWRRRRARGGADLAIARLHRDAIGRLTRQRLDAITRGPGPRIML
jgi:hypothetical protein